MHLPLWHLDMSCTSLSLAYNPVEMGTKQSLRISSSANEIKENETAVFPLQMKHVTKRFVRAHLYNPG